MNTDQFLKQHDACADGAEFALKYATLAEAWDACERPDWLLWAYQRAVKPDEKQIRLFACWCVRQVWDLLTDPRSRRAVEAAEAYAEGRATEGELKSAWADVFDVSAAAYAAAAEAACSAINCPATNAAAYASYAAAYAANTTADFAQARKAQATQLKLMIPNPFRK